VLSYRKGVESRPFPACDGSSWNWTATLCAPMRATTSSDEKPFAAKAPKMLSRVPRLLGTLPTGAAFELSLRPTSACTLGPSGHAAIACAPANWIMSAALTWYLSLQSLSFVQIAERPAFSDLPHSSVRTRLPSQPLLMQSWKGARRAW